MILALPAVLARCSSGSAEQRIASEVQYSDSAFRADSARLLAIIRNDSIESEASLRERRSSKYGAYTGEFIAPPPTYQSAVAAGAALTPAASPARDSVEPDVSARVARAGVRGLKAQQIAQYLRGTKGQVSVTILYGPHCPRSEGMFPGFVALREAHQDEPVQVTAIATDDPEDVRGFLSRFGAPFAPLFAVRGRPGDLSRALEEFGISLPSPFNLPYVAVLDPEGKAVGQWDAATNLASIDAAVREALRR
jgi:hypothetical protein